MISLVTDKNINHAKKIAGNTQAVKIAALLKAYGTGQRFFETWIHNEKTLIARLDGNFTVYAPQGADIEEIAAFLSLSPFLQTVYGPAETIYKISQFVESRHNITEWNVMQYVCLPSAATADGCIHSVDHLFKNTQSNNHAGVFPKPGISIEKSPRLASLLSVLQRGGLINKQEKSVEAVYADLSHRIRHGCSRAYMISENGFPASCCLTGAESDYAGLINGVATLPEYQRRGYASALVSIMRDDLINCGKVPVLECSGILLPFYTRLGFKISGSAAEITMQ